MTDTRTEILAAITKVAPDVEPDQIDPDADLRDELDIDSMDFLNILVAVHERLGVSVPEADYPKVDTLEALVRYVEHRRSATA